ncbi:MAG TPA: ArsI/CadI family heavy metal resistance metalloenzyme [Pyrinomonadaceae bacterium]|nr:ArsI/CadI family heavy metal resistance metalloenzyme [Pyrinomonadaceae bacterium]
MESKTENQVTALKAHLALNVKNVEQSIEFYKKMFGIEPSKVRTGYAKFDVQNPPLNLTLNQVAFNERGALSHLGIQLSSTADVLAMRKKWENAGLVTRDEMQTNCCYATQDKTWVHDPDGNEWEAFVVLKDNLAESVACCGIDAGVTEEKSETVSATANESVSCCATSTTPATIARV